MDRESLERIRRLEGYVISLQERISGIPIRTGRAGGAGGGGTSSGIVSVDTYNDLSEITTDAPVMAFTRDTERYYVKSGASWIGVSHLA